MSLRPTTFLGKNLVSQELVQMGVRFLCLFLRLKHIVSPSLITRGRLCVGACALSSGAQHTFLEVRGVFGVSSWLSSWSCLCF